MTSTLPPAAPAGGGGVHFEGKIDGIRGFPARPERTEGLGRAKGEVNRHHSPHSPGKLDGCAGLGASEEGGGGAAKEKPGGRF